MATCFPCCLSDLSRGIVPGLRVRCCINVFSYTSSISVTCSGVRERLRVFSVLLKWSARYSWLVLPSVKAEDVVSLRTLEYAAFRSANVMASFCGVMFWALCCWMMRCNVASTAEEDALRNSWRVSSKSKNHQDAVFKCSLPIFEKLRTVELLIRLFCMT